MLPRAHWPGIGGRGPGATMPAGVRNGGVTGAIYKNLEVQGLGLFCHRTPKHLNLHIRPLRPICGTLPPPKTPQPTPRHPQPPWPILSMSSTITSALVFYGRGCNLAMQSTRSRIKNQESICLYPVLGSIHLYYLRVCRVTRTSKGSGEYS